jgi:hypothetical protein
MQETKKPMAILNLWQPYPFAAADALLQIGTAVISAFFRCMNTYYR